ncbi:MAG: hypothetical protein P9L99_14210 [Candidatus Lernaella stagnicola]|nr:hypothetical protein [Candidatus Lernaella stagnicola]
MTTNRTNILLNAIIGELAIAPVADDVEHVIVADEGFADALRMRGKYDLPLLAVAYGGAPSAGPMGTGREEHEAAVQYIVFIATRNRAGIDSTLVDLYDLKDAVIDALAGKRPVQRTRAGDAELDDDENEVELAAPLLYAGDKIVGLNKEIEDKGVRCWAVQFVTEQAFVPGRTELTDPDVIEAIEGTFDRRPGEDPETPEADKDEFELEFGDE